MQDDDQPIRIKLRGFGSEDAPARRWVSKQYSTHPANPLNPKQIVFDHGNAVTLVELSTDWEDPETAVIKWIQSTPQKTGAATKTIKQLQQDAADSDISLKLDIFQTGPVDPSRLEQIYAALGFEKDDDDSMIWHPHFTEAWSKSYKKSIDCSNPKGFSQRAHCAARRKRQAGGKTASKSLNEQTLTETIMAYHGSPKRNIRSKRFWPLSHFGTEKAAQDRMKMYAKHKKVFGANPNFDYRVYQVELNINNPAMIKDEDVSHDPTQFAFALHKAKIFSKLEMMTVTVWPTIKSTSHDDYQEANLEARKYPREKQRQVSAKQLIKLLKSKGYDGMVYKNKHEDRGSLSYVILDASQARIVRSRRVDEEWALEESVDRGDFSTVFRNRSNEEGGHRFTLSADEFVEHIDKQLSSGYTGDQAVVELAMLYDRHPHKVKNWPELVAVLNTHKAELLKIITYHYTKELHHHSMTRSAIVSSALIAAGVTWPELQSMLEQNKAKIIKGLLTLIKDDADDYAIRQIRALRDAHVNWPELGMMHKSIAIVNEPLNESKKVPALDTLLLTIEPHIARSIKQDVAKMRSNMERMNHRPIVQFLSDISVYALTIGKAKLVEVVEATKPLMLEYIEHILSMYNRAFSDHSESEPLYWTLKSIAHINRRVGVVWPELDSLLEKYKTGIIKTCLKQAKMANSYSIEDLEGLLEQLNDIGVDWPELTIIKKSLSTGINESREVTAADLGDATDQRLRTAARLATQLVNKMRMGYTFAITNSFGDLRSYGVDDAETVRTVFNAVKPEVIEYITYLLSRVLDSTLPEGLVIETLNSALHSILLVKQTGATVTELNDIIVSKKADIVRVILVALKNGDPIVVTFNILSILESLGELGCNWPEIEIIHKSLKQSRKRLRENDLDPIFKQIDAEQSKLTIIQQLGLANLRSLLRRGKLANGSMHAFMVHLNYLKLNDAQKATVYPQLDQDFAAFITRRIKKKEMRIVLNVFGGLVLNGIDCPAVIAVINKHKPAVMKELLDGIRTHYDQVSKLVTEIVDKQILDWPELDIIMKSIRSTQLKENNVLDKPTPSVEELAVKHNCTPQDVLIELRKGVAVEKEHTNRLDVAREIAMDHLNEDLYYYEKLAKVERTNTIKKGQ
jgi:hypothetical protein